MIERFLSILISFTFIFESTISIAQNTNIFKGKIIDQKTKEAIAYTNVYDSIQKAFTTSDSNGIFYIELPSQIYHFEISNVGYETILKEINLNKNIDIHIELQQNIRLSEINISTTKLAKTATVNASGMTTLTAATLERLPTFLGEKDILKAVLLTPGIQSGQEGARGIFVRGGSPDQNLVLFGNAPVFNASHIYGFLSVFTAEAIQKMEIHKNYIPVQYGGRLSSVLNIEPNFGNTEKWKGDFSIGLITSKFHIEGPIKKEKTSFNFSIRDCHAGIFTMPITKMQYKKIEGGNGGFSYFFYDINAAIQHKINNKNTLSWSFYTGNDFYTFKEKREFPKKKYFYSVDNKKFLKWMNIASGINWKTQLKKLWIDNYFTFSFYKLYSKQNLDVIDRDYTRFINTINYTDYRTTSKINDNGWQTNIYHLVNKNHSFNYGIKLNQRNFTINNVSIFVEDSLRSVFLRDTFSNPKVHSLDMYLYVDYLFSWKDKLELKTGIQLFNYHIQNKNYFYPIPRLEIIYHPISSISLRASAIRNVQTVHLLTNNTGEIQNDVWVPASKNVPPETAWQYSGGIQYEHPKGYSASIDAYYKSMYRLTEYRYGTTFMINKLSWDKQLLNSGTGQAYGVEFFAAKTSGQFTAWFKYNVGWSTRQFPELNEGKKYFYKYDRRHDVSIVLQYKLKKHFDFSIAWTYGTGWRMTTPNSKYASDGTLYDYDVANEPLLGNQNMITNWNARNNYVLPAFHHLDIGMNYEKKAKRVTHKFNVSIYNLYNQFNIFAVYRSSNVDESGNKYKEFKQISLFPITPSIGYTLSFEK